MILSRFTSLIEDFVTSRFQVTKQNFSARGASFCKVPLSFWSQADVRNFGLSGSEHVNTVHLWFRCHFRRMFKIWFQITVVRMHAILFFSDFLWNPVTSKEDLSTGLSKSSCHPSLIILVWDVWEFAPVSWIVQFVTSLQILNLKMNLKQVEPVPCVLVPTLFSTSPVIAMLETNCFQDWWITLTRQEVRNCLSCRWYSSRLWLIVAFDRWPHSLRVSVVFAKLAQRWDCRRFLE